MKPYLSTLFWSTTAAALMTTAVLPSAFAQTPPSSVSFLSSSQPQSASLTQVDPTKPVTRGFIAVHSEPARGGAKLTVEVFQDRLNSPVTLSLFVAVNNGQKTFAVPLKVLTTGKPDPTFYIQKEEFVLDYKELQAFFDHHAPKAKGLKIEAGVPLVVKADFATGHDWGGFDRGGVFFLPPALDQNGKLTAVTSHQVTAVETGPKARATALDVAYPIVNEMANTFNDRATGAGLKIGGQIRSRVEAEGKFQLVTEKDYLDAKKRMLALAADPAEQLRIFGPGWTLKLEDRYMKRDANGVLLLDAHGLPVPDPMVDTYMDNDHHDAASADMAIRYRWTEGNKTGSWNAKLGIGRVDPVTGITYRIESGVDTTDDKPGTIAKFFDSLDPRNPLRPIYDMFTGKKPSDFLKPSVKIEDVRHKFKLVNQNNLGIEISTDDVYASDLRGSGKKARYFQLEMDIDHLSTASQNVAKAYSGGVVYNFDDPTYAGGWGKWDHSVNMQTARAKFLASVSPSAFFDGRPVLHTAEDLDPNSPILQSRKTDFDESARVITALRDHVLGSNWHQGAQKYAYAAALLDVLPAERFSGSVKKVSDVLTEQKKLMGPQICQDIFAAI